LSLYKDKDTAVRFVFNVFVRLRVLYVIDAQLYETAIRTMIRITNTDRELCRL